LSDGSRAYLVRFRTNDGHQRSKQFKRKKDAEAYVSLIDVDRLRGALIDPRLGRITLNEWLEKWWPTVTDLRRTTKARDEQFLRSYALPTFGNVPLARIERTELRRWVATLIAPKQEGGGGMAPATVQKAVQVLNKAMRAAVEDRLIPYNPVADLPLPRIEHEEMRFLTADEVWRRAAGLRARRPSSWQYL
jgi:hypothetical protein